jgi:raffinose/stachyose/melibiose transport system permease protein
MGSITARRSAAPPTPGTGRRRRAPRGYAVYLVPGIVAFTLIIAVPLVANIAVSFSAWRGVGTPNWIGLQNYGRLMDDATFWAAFRHNVGMIIAMAIIPTLIGLLLGSVLFDHVARVHGQRAASALRAGYYLPQVLPIAIAGVVWGWILHPTYGALNVGLEALGLGGLTRNWLGEQSTALPAVMGVMIWFQIGYPVVVFMAGLQRVDPELYEAASLDGASWWHRLRHITVPMIRPEIFVVLLTTTIAALKLFAPIYVLTKGGPGTATIVPSYFAYQNFFEIANVGYGAAIATVLTVIISALTIVFLRAQFGRDAAEEA